MFNPAFLPGVIAVALLLLCGMAYLMRAGLRTRNLDSCWHCGAAKVRPSRPRSVDSLATIFLLRPYRCAGCLTRFYGFRSIGPHRPISSVPVEPAPRRKRAFPVRVKVIVRLSLPTTWEGAWELMLAEEEGFKSSRQSLR